MPDEEVDSLVAELANDGRVVTREEARTAVLQVAELLLLVEKEFGLSALVEIDLPIQASLPPPPVE